MAFDELLADRIRIILKEKQVQYTEKKMMGGLTFMVDEKMCIGIVKNNLMARVGPDQYVKALSRNGCKPMDFTGRPLKGYVFVEPYGVDMEEDLVEYIQMSLDYNPLAKSSRKKSKK